LRQEFLRRNDLGGNAILLIRHTGMRIGECADLSCDCLRSTGPNQWAIHVPLGKLKTERMVPVDRLSVNSSDATIFSLLDPLPADASLWPARSTKEALVRQPPRLFAPGVSLARALPRASVPHQLRHSYATEMLRSGVGFPAVIEATRPHFSRACRCAYSTWLSDPPTRVRHWLAQNGRHLAPRPKALSRLTPSRPRRRDR